MAYQIKSIRYQNTPRKILLQNINGPCPLLATANALLLRGVISLSSECIRNGVCSTDDVVTMLANRALLCYNTNNNNSSSNSNSNSNSNMDEDSPNKSNHEYHLNEVLSILPSLQHGMDVNPKFTSVECVEYTKNLSAFDVLGVTLVHGWLVDPTHDVEACSIIGNKSYNELIELVILGNELRNDGVIDKLEKEMQVKIDEREKLLTLVSVDNNIDDPDEKNDNGDSCENDKVEADAHDKDQTEQEENNDIDDNADYSSSNDQKQTNTTVQRQQLKTIEKEIVDLQNKLEEASLQISKADVVNSFLTSTSHQLTYHGLEQLHKHVGDDALHVFFRNNHFATLTKHDGGLYLLVTDLGYANTPEIIWEKLDSIDGNTEYVNEYFERPSPRTELIPASGPTIDPALLLAQRSQTETDYQLAMAISRGDTSASSSNHHHNTDDEEGKLIEAAKELSLRTYHGETDATVAVTTENPNSTNAAQQEKGNSQMESDHQIALAYQRQEEQLDHESEQLARQLQELDRQELQLQQQRSRRQGGAPARRQRTEETKSGCIIS